MQYSEKIKQGLYLLGIFACSLIFAELALRFAGAVYGKIPRLAKLNKQEYTIVCLGDSFTYGWGLDRDKTYPAQLEKMIKADTGMFPEVSVINLGVPGTNSSQVLQTIQGLLKQAIKPDMVIILVGANDAWNFARSNISGVAHMPALEAAIVKGKIFFSEFRIYKLIQTIMLNIKGRTFELDRDVFDQIAESGPIDRQLINELVSFNLKRIIKLLRKENIEVVLHSYPRGGPLEQGFYQDVSAQFGVIYVDHYQDFREKIRDNKMTEVFLYDNSHPNETGCAIIAKNIFTAIKGGIRK
ncbi:MAG: hypothetical protein HY810_09015 [Candidatus Omnitrophica bacterium]|nr:hypothetical protein [Candidatus Omnitrophota bacterium]